MKKEIPVMFCFDNNYVIPAGVAFYSLLENANKKYKYKFYILHSDITNENIEKLKQTIESFSDICSLEFINMTNRFSELWEKIKTKGHFSKEVMYKVLVASIFPQYEKLIVSDVDVVFLGDISKSYIDFNVNENVYLAGVKAVGKIMGYMQNYKPQFTDEEIEKLSGFCGGYIVFNLKKLREDKMEKKFIKCFEEEGYRINQMEQDVLNLCCYPNTKALPLNYVTCSYVWDYYKEESDFKNDVNYTEEELKDAMKNPIQLHYATSTKPWKNVDSTKSEVWFQYLVKTPFLRDYLVNLPNKIVIPEARIKKLNSTKDLFSKFIKKIFKLIIRIMKKIFKIIKRIFSYIKRIFSYMKNNPLFIFNKRFYKKVSNKLNIFKKLSKDKGIDLLIFDDSFPDRVSPFRYEEFIEYLMNIYNSKAINTKGDLASKSDKEKSNRIVGKFIKSNKEFERRFINKIESEEKIYCAVFVFLNNVYSNMETIEKNEIPFIFTLYPGGGFSLNSEESDDKLSRVLSSPMFRGVIVTQKITQDYLISKKLCDEKKIHFIYGGVVTKDALLNTKKSNKKYYGIDKKTMDICFVAHKYSEKGKDKGYDLFIESAKKISKKYSDIKFHVVGEFDREDINVDDLGEKINFYGIKGTDWLRDFFGNMDIIMSPNKPFVLSPGSFDGFPTTSCLEAMLNNVAFFGTDELSLNCYYEDKKDMVIIKHDAEDILKKVAYYYDNPNELIEIAKNGCKRTKKNYSFEKQVLPRIEIIEKIIKESKERKNG